MYVFIFFEILITVDYEFMAFKIQFSSQVNQVLVDLPSNYIHARPQAVPLTPSDSSGPIVQATHISLSGIQSFAQHFSSVVLGLGHRGNKSFIRLALERAEGSRRRHHGATDYMFLYMERSLGSWGWVAVSFRWKWQTVSVMTIMRARMKPRMRGSVSSRRSRWSVMHLQAARSGIMNKVSTVR